MCSLALPQLTPVHVHIGWILCRDENVAHVSGSRSSTRDLNFREAQGAANCCLESGR